VYEGRGWDIVGTHAPNYNSRSIGICFIGDFRGEKVDFFFSWCEVRLSPFGTSAANQPRMIDV
jgi:hypothetical protein